jgi:predicted GNAT family acetyltransferase
MTDVTHAPERARFEAGSAYLSYERHGQTFDIKHTVVPEEKSGQGLGGKLVQAAVAYAKEQGLDLVVTCSFARGWLEKHPVG